ncbi:MAG TPA: ROK family protein [Gemmatimonadaceae bacterium]|nr:ROK family protein [Gemmatimonadaceae bacterium]
MTFVGADLGGTKLAVAAFTSEGEVISREVTQLGNRRGAAVGSLIVERLQRLGAEHRSKAAGVCVPGLYRSDRGTVWAPNIDGWDDYPLLDELRTSLGQAVRITIDSDRAAYILGETWRGAARGARDAIFLAIGTGIGAGILSGGKVVRGHGDVGGAIGWLALDRPFKSRYHQHGCLEDQASGPGLVRVARDLMHADVNYAGALGIKDPEDLDAGDIFAAHERGDRIAHEVLDNAIELWGMTVANLVSLFNPEIIVFGGGVFGPAGKFLDRIRTEARRWAQPIAIEQVRLVVSALGSDAGLFGAGRLAMIASGETST